MNTALDNVNSGSKGSWTCLKELLNISLKTETALPSQDLLRYLQAKLPRYEEILHGCSDFFWVKLSANWITRYHMPVSMAASTIEKRLSGLRQK